MIHISGSTSNVDNHIVDTNRMDLNDITPGSYYACKYDNDLYFCIVNYVSMEHGDVNLNQLHFSLYASFAHLIIIYYLTLVLSSLKNPNQFFCWLFFDAMSLAKTDFVKS